MKVLLAATSSMVGGVKSYIDGLKKGLEHKKYEARIVFPPEVTNLTKLMIGIKVVGNRDRGRKELNMWVQEKLYERIKSLINEVDIFHAQDALTVGCLIENYLNVPIVLTVHGPISREAEMLGKGSPEYLKYLKEQEREAYERASVIIAVDTVQKQIMCDDFGIKPEKIKVIYNGVDASFFVPSDDFKVSETNPYFLVPRRLVPKNGVQTAIEAMNYIKPNIRLWIAGDGPERERLKKLAFELGIKDRVRFLGWVDKKKMVQLMNQASGIIVPSIPVNGVIEASSIAALEGMSVGKPVIASKIGGLREIIKDKETGFLFEAGNAKELAEIMEYIVHNPDTVKKIGENARNHVMENHSIDIWLEKVLEVYEIAVGKNK